MYEIPTPRNQPCLDPTHKMKLTAVTPHLPHRHTSYLPYFHYALITTLLKYFSMDPHTSSWEH